MYFASNFCFSKRLEKFTVNFFPAIFQVSLHGTLERKIATVHKHKTVPILVMLVRIPFKINKE